VNDLPDDAREAHPASAGSVPAAPGEPRDPTSAPGGPSRTPDDPALIDPATAPTTPVRPAGRPAPQYGENAPEGWVNPVELERARAERERSDRERADRERAAAQPPAVGWGSVDRAGSVRQGRPGGAGQPNGDRGHPGPGAPSVPASRLGASPVDLLLTLLLLAFGLTTVLDQVFGVGQTAATIADQIAARYTALANPRALLPASALCAVVDVLLFAGTVLWSVRRLRRRRLTFWVPLAAGALAGLFAVVVYVVVLVHDPAYLSWVVSHSRTR
jgi:hypothetical protein